MRLVILEYLASLRERNELDAILPDLLTELGYQVYSRPGRGARQYGVDVAAVGTDQAGTRKVYLFSVKAGNLTRSVWNTASPQSLRPSLDEILDFYIPTHIPVEYSSLPIVICLCFGGDIDEQVRGEVTQYLKRNETDKIRYEQWNGDKLADLILSGILREELLPAELRAHLRKAAALVEEPVTSVSHFRTLVKQIVASAGPAAHEKLTRARLINICLWILYGWAREADNVEAPYVASELAVLEAWHLLKDIVARPTVQAAEAGQILNSLIELHFAIWDDFYRGKLKKHVAPLHAVSSAIPSHSALDVNLKLFELLGRMAQRALWEVWKRQDVEENVPARLVDDEHASLDQQIGELVELISGNPVLFAPIADEQIIDIATALTLLGCRPPFRVAINQWLTQLASNYIFNFRSHTHYPTCARSYWDLVAHPAERTDKYRTEATQGSVLLPTLALWANALGNSDVNDHLARFKASDLAHCNLQVWVPGTDSEELLYASGEAHGAALSNVPIKIGITATLDYVNLECESDTVFDSLSAISLGHWPIVIMACRHHRLPLPPQLWRGIFHDLQAEQSGPAS